MAAGIVTDPKIIHKGETSRRIVTFKAGGTPIDLTGCSATAHLRSGTPDNPGSITLNASTVTATRLEIYGDADNGQIRWTAAAADTAAMTVGDYFQEWWVTFADGTKELALIIFYQVRAAGGTS